MRASYRAINWKFGTKAVEEDNRGSLFRLGTLFEAAHSAPHSKIHLNIGIECSGFDVPIKYNAIWSRNMGQIRNENHTAATTTP